MGLPGTGGWPAAHTHLSRARDASAGGVTPDATARAGRLRNRPRSPCRALCLRSSELCGVTSELDDPSQLAPDSLEMPTRGPHRGDGASALLFP